MTDESEAGQRERFGAGVKHYRDMRRISQVKLGLAADLHPQTISDIERGVMGTSKETKDAIAAALNVTVDDLLAHASARAAS